MTKKYRVIATTTTFVNADTIDEAYDVFRYNTYEYSSVEIQKMG